MSESNEVVGFRAKNDQYCELVREIAPAVRSVYDAMIEQKFSEREALDLTKQWIHTTLGGKS